MSPTEPETPGPDSEPPTSAGGERPAATAPERPPVDPPTQVTPPAEPDTQVTPPAPPAAVAPPPPPAPVAPPSPVAPPAPPPAIPAEPATTSAGLPNPYGLPEIAVERPEVGVGAAFAGGLVLAMILKRFVR